MPTVTMYMRSDQHTVNGLTAYKLDTVNSASLKEISGCSVDTRTHYFHIGIRVFIVHPDGSEDEVTDGTAVAIAPVGTGSDITTTTCNTWDCPERLLYTEDAIKIVVECMCGYSWSESSAVVLATFVTEQLGAVRLNASTWHVCYRIRRDQVYEFGFRWWHYYFRFGRDADASYIENFSYSVPAGVTHKLARLATNVRVRPHAIVLIKRNDEIVGYRKPHAPYRPERPIQPQQ